MTSQDRKIEHISWSYEDIVNFGFQMTFWIFHFCFLTSTFAGLPEIVPMKFTMSGQVSSTGPAWFLWVMLAVGAIITITTGTLACIPWAHKYPWPIDKNPHAFYQLNRTLMLSVGLYMNVLFLISNERIIWAAQGGQHGLGCEFWVFALLPLVVILWGYVSKGRKLSQ